MSFYKEPPKFRNFSFNEDYLKKEPTKFRNFSFSDDKLKKEPTKFRNFSFSDDKFNIKKEPIKFRNLSELENKNEPIKFKNFSKQENIKQSIKIKNFSKQENIKNSFKKNNLESNNSIFNDNNKCYIIGNIIYKINNMDYDSINKFCSNRNNDIDIEKQKNKIQIHTQIEKDLDNLWLNYTIDLDFWNEICNEYLTEKYFYEEFLEIVTINNLSKKNLKLEVNKLKQNLKNVKKINNFNILKKKIILFYLNHP